MTQTEATTNSEHHKPSAKVILDSISEDGHRLTTLEVRMHRFVLAEFNTHRMFSRNAASSRAIPVHKRIKAVMDYPAMPVEWGTNQKGMQAGEPIGAEEQANAETIWLDARDTMVKYTQQLILLGVHKQIANRLLEPWVWVTDIVSATDWDNFYRQRCSRYSQAAQPEMRAAADAILHAMEDSEPIPMKNTYPVFNWHTPYIQLDEYQFFGLDVTGRIKVSVARCARVSYLTQGGVRDIDEDLALYNRLTAASPPHWSPTEHVATPMPGRHGNFNGWRQWRQTLEEAGRI
jgi:thymidylate synthase ThyX